MPIPRFIDKLKYNKESHIRLCQLGKDTYEAELRQMAIDKENRAATLKEKTKYKMRQNIGKIEFLNENNKWVEEISNKEIEFMQ